MQIMEHQQLLLTEFRRLIRSLLQDRNEEAIKTISFSTLNRWANGTSVPRSEKVVDLVRSLSGPSREQLQQISEQLWPSLILSSEARLASSIIPSAFYAKVLQTYAETPEDLMYESLCSIILLQILQHIDRMRTGTSLTVIHCVPHHTGKVKGLCTGASLRLPTNLHQKLYLFGAESLPGRAIASFQLSMQPQVVPYEIAGGFEGQGCAAVVPILRAGHVGGGLLGVSPHENHFSEEICNLLNAYAGLLALAFPTNAFFEKAQLELGVFPDGNHQETVLSSFEERIVALIRSTRGLTRSQAQTLALRDIIDELI